MFRFLSIFAALTVPAAAYAAPRPVVVEGGKPKVIMQIVHLDPKDCKIKPAGQVHVQSQPKNGKINVQLAETKGKSAKCGEVTGKVIRVNYAAKPGYKGSDEAEFVLVVPPEQSKDGAIERRFFKVPIEVR